MKYNFDEVHNRLGTYCTQWDYIEDRFQKKDLIPFSISDTDFIIPKPITKKIHEVADHQIYVFSIIVNTLVKSAKRKSINNESYV